MRLWFVVYLFCVLSFGQVKLGLNSTIEKRDALLRQSKGMWDSQVLKNGGEYCYSVSSEEGPEKPGATPHITYEDTIFVSGGLIERVERMYSDGRVTHPKIAATTFEQVYHFCVDNVAHVTSAEAETLVLETNSQNFLIRCAYLSKGNNTWSGYYSLSPMPSRCSSAYSWMLPLFIFAPLAILLALVGLVVFLHSKYPGNVIPTEQEFYSFLLNNPYEKKNEDEHEENDRDFDPKIVISSGPRPHVLEDDEGPSDPEVPPHLHHHVHPNQNINSTTTTTTTTTTTPMSPPHQPSSPVQTFTRPQQQSPVMSPPYQPSSPVQTFATTRPQQQAPVATSTIDPFDLNSAKAAPSLFGGLETVGNTGEQSGQPSRKQNVGQASQRVEGRQGEGVSLFSGMNLH